MNTISILTMKLPTFFKKTIDRMKCLSSRSVKRSLVVCYCILAGVSSGSATLPSGEQVVAGNAAFQRDGGLMQVTASDGSIINYQSFSIGADNTVQFIQPGSSASVLNRVTAAANPTQILGTLTANGQVYLVNPAGISFGQNAMVDVGSLFAAAGNISDEDFLKGLNRFSGLDGEVTNFGSIRADGSVALLGSSVFNFGSIVAGGDMVALASGEELYLGERGGHLFIRIDKSAGGGATGEPAVENAGRVEAESGASILASGDMLGMSVLHSGIIESRTARIEAEGVGEVHVDGGRIDASESVDLLGDKVGLFGETEIAAGDAQGGGAIRIGGDRKGLNPEVRNARAVHVGADATISADAKISGNGGELIVFAEETAIVLGTLTAKGAQGSAGGFVETSGKEYLVVGKAPQIGQGGSWLIDPNNIEIVAGGGNTNINAADPFQSNDDSVQLGVDLIIAALTGGATVDVITTNSGANSEDGNITLSTTLDYNGTGTNTLVFDAANNIAINQAITDGSGSGDNLNLTLQAGGTINFGASVDLGNIGSLIATVGGNISQSGALSVGGTSSFTTTADDSDITLTDAGNALTGAVSFTSDDTNANDAEDVDLVNSIATVLGGSTESGSLDVTSGGDITQTGALDVDGAATFTTTDGSSIELTTTGNSFADSVTFRAGATGTDTFNDIGFSDDSAVVLANAAVGDGDLFIDAGTDGAVGGNLNVASGGNISQTVALLVGDTSSFTTTADDADITLTDASNALTGAVSFTSDDTNANDAEDIDLVNSIATVLGGSTESGSLDVTSGGDITQTGALDVDGAATFTTTTDGNSIELTTTGNSFGDSVTFSAGAGGTDTFNNIGFSDDGAVVLANAAVGDGDLFIDAGTDGAVGGNLDVESGGNISQTVALNVDGTSSFTTAADDSDITLTDAGNALTGAVSFTSDDTNSNDAEDIDLVNSIATVLGGSTESGTLDVTSGGDITQTGALDVDGTATFTTTTDGSSIELTTTGNSFGGSVSFSAGASGTDTFNNIGFSDDGAVVLANAAVGDGDLSIDAGTDGAVGGNLDVESGGNISQTVALNVDGTSSFTTAADDSDITLTDAGNALTGAVSFTSDDTNSNDAEDIDLVNSIATVLGGSTESGTLDVTSGGNITQTGALNVDGTSSFTATADEADITLTNAGNALAGAVTFNSDDTNANDAEDIDLVNSIATVLGGSTESGTLDVTSGGSITQTGTLDVDGTSSVTTTADDADITLTNAGNALVGAATFISDDTNGNDAEDVDLVNSVATVLGGSTESGTLDVTSGGSITQTGALDVDGTSSFTTSADDADITLTDAGNALSGAVTVNSDDTNGNDAEDIDLVNSIATVLGGSTETGTLDVTSAGNITQTGALDVDGGAVFVTSTDSSSIELASAGNSFADSVTFRADAGDETLNNIAFTDGGSLNFTTAALTDGDFFIDAATDFVVSGLLHVATSSGPITVNEALVAGTDVLLLTDPAGIIDINADVTGDSNVSVISAAGVTQDGVLTATSGDVYVEAQAGDIEQNANTVGGVDVRYLASGSVEMAAGTSSTATSGDIRYEAEGGNVNLGRLSASDSASVLGSANISDVNSDSLANIEASRARLVAGGSIGSGSSAPSDTNIAAVDLGVNNVEAVAGTNVYLQSDQSVTVGGVGDVTTETDYVHLPSGVTTETDTDLNLAGLEGTAGVVKLKSADTITVGETVVAGTDVLLLTDPAGDIDINADVTSGSNASVISAAGVTQDGVLTATAGDVYVEAQAGDIEQNANTVGGVDVRYLASGSVEMAAGTSSTAASGDIRYEAEGGNVDLGQLSASDSASVLASGNVTDANGDELANIGADRIRLDAGGSIGSGSGLESDTNLAAVDISVNNVEAVAGTDVYLQSDQTVTVGGVGDVTTETDYARFASGVTTETDTDLNFAGLEGTAGVVKLKSDGTITVDETVVAGTDALLLTDPAGDIDINADVTSGQNASVISAGGVSLDAGATLTATSGDLYVSGNPLDLDGDVIFGDGLGLESTGAYTQEIDLSGPGDIRVTASDIAMNAGISTTSTGGNIRYEATSGNVGLRLLDAAVGAVSVLAGGNITDGDSNELANIEALRARLDAGGSIGSGDGSQSDTNVAAVDISVANVEAVAGTDVYLQSDQAATVGGVGDVTTETDYARFTSGMTTETDTDLNLEGLEGTAGVLKLKSDETITVDETVVAGTDVLLLTDPAGDIDINADVTGGSNVGVISAAGVTQDGVLTATDGDLYVTAQGGNIEQNANTVAGTDVRYDASGSVEMAAGTSSTAIGGDIRYEAEGGNVDLGQLSASDSASVLASGNVTDANGDELANIGADRTRLDAGGSIGSGSGLESDTNVAAVDISVNNVEAVAGTDVYLQSEQAVTVGGVGDVTTETDYARFASGVTTETDTDLNFAGLEGTAGVVKLKSDGTITVNETLVAGTDALLLTDPAGDIDIDADVTGGQNASVISAGGVSVDAGATLTATSGDLYVSGNPLDLDGDVIFGGGLGLESTGAYTQEIDLSGPGDIRVTASDIAMNAGTSTTSTGGDIRYEATSGNMALRLLDAAVGAVSILAGGNITDGDSNELANIEALRARLDAAGSIGSGSGAASDMNVAAVDLGVNNVEAVAGTDIYLQSDQTVTVGGVGEVTTETGYARYASGVTTETDTDLNLEGLEGTAGVVKLKSDGTITVNETVVAGTDVLLLSDPSGDIDINANVTGGQNASVISTAGVSLDAGATLTSTSGDLYVSGNPLDLDGELVFGDGLGLESTGAFAQKINLSGTGDIRVTASDITMNAGISTTSTGGDIRYEATGGNVGLRLLDAAVGAVSVLAGGTITDGDSNELANIEALRARLEAGGSIGSGSGLENDTNAEAVDISVNNVEAVAGTEVYLQSDQAVTVGGVGDVTTEGDYARFASGVTTESDTDLNLAGLEGTSGVAKLKSDGTITVNETVVAGTDALLLTDPAGDIDINADVTGGSNASVISAGGVNLDAASTLEATGGDLYVSGDPLDLDGSLIFGDGLGLESTGAYTQEIDLSGSGDIRVTASDITMNAGISTTSTGGNIRYEATTGNVALRLLDAAVGAVSVLAGGTITDGDSNELANIAALRARLDAGGSIGSGDGSESDTNPAALDISVDNVEAVAGTNVYLQSDQAVNVGSVGDVTTEGDYARFASGVTTESDTDLDLAGLEGTSGVAKLGSDGTITVNETVVAGTEALLLTDPAGGIDISAGVTGGSNVGVISAGGVTQDAVLTATAGDVYVTAQGGDIEQNTNTVAGTDIRYAASGSVEMAAGTSSTATAGDIRYSAAGGNVDLGQLTASDSVSVLASADIADADGDQLANIAAQRARLDAGGSIGSGDGSESDTNPAALDISVDKVEAVAGTNVYLQSDQAVTVGGVGDVTTEGDYARFASGVTIESDTDLNLAGLEGTSGVVKLKSDGTITLNETLVAGTETLLLTDPAGDTDINADVIGASNASVVATGDINQNADVSVTGGTIDVEAIGGSLAMQDGTVASSNGGNIRYSAAQDATISQLDAGSGDISVIAGNNLIDARTDTVALNSDGQTIETDDSRVSNILANRVQFEAGTDIGASNNPIDTDVQILAAEAGGSAYIFEANDLEVGTIPAVDMERIRLNSASSTLSDTGKTGFQVATELALWVWDSLTLFGDVETSGDQTYRYALNTAANGKAGKQIILNDNTLRSTGGDILTTGERTSIDLNSTAFIGDNRSSSPAVADGTVYNEGSGNVSIIADAGSVLLGLYEKLVVGNDAPANPSGFGNLTLTAGTSMEVGDVAVAGDLDITTPTLTLLERDPAAARLNDNLPGGSTIQDDKGTDIVAKGDLTITGDTIQGSDNGATQSQIGIGADTFTIAAPNIGNEIITGPQASGETFASNETETPTFDFIATPATTLFSFVQDLSNIEIDLEDEEISEPIRVRLLDFDHEGISVPIQEQLSKLGIFSRNLTPREEKRRRILGHLIVSTIVVDDAVPTTAYEIPNIRISPGAAERAIGLAMKVLDTEQGGLESIADNVAKAYREFSQQNPNGSPEEFASYLRESPGRQATMAGDALNPLVNLFSMISTIGVTPKELEISRESVISRLRIEGLRGRELFEFFDAYAPNLLQVRSL